MKNYNCDKCEEKITSIGIDYRIGTCVTVVEMDLCEKCKDKCNKEAKEYQIKRDKQDAEFIKKLKEKIKKK